MPLPGVTLPPALVGSAATVLGIGRPIDLHGPFVVELGNLPPDLGCAGWFREEDFIWCNPDRERQWGLAGYNWTATTMTLDVVSSGPALLRPIDETDQWLHTDDEPWPVEALVAHARRLLGMDRG